MARAGRLAGKRALITGAGTGIGRAIALEFAREGADVVLHYSHDEAGVWSAVSEMEGCGGRVRAIQARFEQVEAAQRLGREALDFLGGLDVLVNNAGVTMCLPFEQVTPEQFDFLYNVNVRSPFFLSQACTPALVSSGGSIINLGSVHGERGSPEHSVYAGTKGAIAAYSRELSIELGLKGIRVNTIAPGSVAVESYYRINPNYDPAREAPKIPCGFVGEPRDVARLAVFLASPDARYIVGQTLVVDGGTTAWLAFSDAFRQPSGKNKMGQQYVPGMQDVRF
jgi:NAD(P)-dependent dehydrogenase (short-subunit alcohol dehydrogenase family)